MSIAAIAVALGVLAGFLSGGRPANARQVRALNALWAGVVLQVAPQLVDVADGLGFVLVVAGYVMLLAFAIANVRLVGMPVVVVGLALNVAVIAANQGMPVRPAAIVAAHQAGWDELAGLDLGAKRHLEERDDRLTLFGDRIPIQPLREVVSFGDLILAFGVANVSFRLLRPLGARRRVNSRGLVALGA